MPTSLASGKTEVVNRLSEMSLSSLSSEVLKPQYERSKVVSGIVHMSVGGFHRAHQAVYADDLLLGGKDFSWGICGVGLLDLDKGMYDALKPQDMLFTVLERDGDREQPRIIGSIVEYIHAPTDKQELLNKLVDPQIRIVSLTITERGYWADPVTRGFNRDIPQIANDLTQPTNPQTAVGIIARALQLRRDKGIAPFTVLSCDNIEDNGKFVKKLVVGYAKEIDADLSSWIEETVTFPCTMVDRITPMTTEQDKALVQSRYGYVDAWPVTCETFRQWVIEDSFCNGRPEWELVGAQMVEDVRPYEFMKIRLLNASHSLMVYLGSLLGYEYIHDIVQDGDISKLIASIMDDEITPTLKPVPGIDLDKYKKTLIQRFSNEAIRDQARRVAMDGSQKIPQCVMPTVRDQLEAGRSVKGIALCLAGWIKYLAGFDENGKVLPIDDPLAEQIQQQARETLEGGEGLLKNSDIFGDVFQVYPRFKKDIKDCLSLIQKSGVRVAIGPKLP